MDHSRYSLWTRRLHWLVFILVAVALILIYAHRRSPKGSTIRALFKWAHIQFGISIILVMLPRVIVRWGSARPPIVPTPPSWQEWLAHLVQFAMYVLLFIVPLLGIANRLWSPDAWNFLGISMPHVAVTDKMFSEQLEDIHKTLGNVLMYLAGAHAVIALAHHFVVRDSTLRSMLPLAPVTAGRFAKSPAMAKTCSGYITGNGLEGRRHDAANTSVHEEAAGGTHRSWRAQPGPALDLESRY